jgi:cbb3-type cytochrome oxidase maturation protein
MNSLLILIPTALVLGGIGLAAFLWAMHTGQFSDLEGSAGRILFDDEPPKSGNIQSSTTTEKENRK